MECILICQSNFSFYFRSVQHVWPVSLESSWLMWDKSKQVIPTYYECNRWLFPSLVTWQKIFYSHKVANYVCLFDNLCLCNWSEKLIGQRNSLISTVYLINMNGKCTLVDIITHWKTTKPNKKALLLLPFHTLKANCPHTKSSCCPCDD